jgi:hypothetical protein
MNYYIIATRKNGTTESEITHYRYNTDMSSTGDIIRKADFKEAVDSDTDKFYSYNTDLSTLVNCEWYLSSNYEWYLKSDPNGTRKDNLLELPDC